MGKDVDLKDKSTKKLMSDTKSINKDIEEIKSELQQEKGLASYKHGQDIPKDKSIKLSNEDAASYEQETRSSVRQADGKGPDTPSKKINKPTNMKLETKENKDSVTKGNETDVVVTNLPAKENEAIASTLESLEREPKPLKKEEEEVGGNVISQVKGKDNCTKKSEERHSRECKTVAPQIKEKENKTSSIESIGIERREDMCTTIPCEEKEDIKELKKETTYKLQSIETKPSASPQQPKEISPAHLISTSEDRSPG